LEGIGANYRTNSHKDTNMNKILVKIRRETSVPSFRAMIFQKNTFERSRRNFVWTKCEVMYKICGTKYLDARTVGIGETGIHELCHCGRCIWIC